MSFVLVVCGEDRWLVALYGPIVDINPAVSEGRTRWGWRWAQRLQVEIELWSLRGDFWVVIGWGI